VKQSSCIHDHYELGLPFNAASVAATCPGKWGAISSGVQSPGRGEASELRKTTERHGLSGPGD